MHKPIASGRVGSGRREAQDTCRAYLQAIHVAPGTVRASYITFQAQAGERSLEDVLANRRRRVGRVHDPSELTHGDLAASDCSRAVLQLVVGSPEDIAATQVLRLGAECCSSDYVDIAYFEIGLTRKAYSELGEEAGLRVFDQRDNPDVRGLRQLQIEGQDADSAIWRQLDETRRREHVLAMLIASPRSEPTSITIAWAHWLAALHEEGLIYAKRRDVRLRVRALPLPHGFLKPLSRVERLRRFNKRLSDYAVALEDTATAVRRIGRIGRLLLVAFGATVGLLVGLSHTDMGLERVARDLLERLTIR